MRCRACDHEITEEEWLETHNDDYCRRCQAIIDDTLGDM